jgi:hypothetical protein
VYDVLEMHALTADRGRVRIWLGVFDEDPPARLEWTLDGAPVEPREVRPLVRAAPTKIPEIVTHTGVFEFDVCAQPPGVVHTFVLRAGWAAGRSVQSLPFVTRALPEAVPTGWGKSFNVLLVSCFYEPRDSVGKLGALVSSLTGGPDRPDLVLAVGDQVYLDNPPLRNYFHVSFEHFLKAFDAKYRKNWQGQGFSQVLRSAPVASIPDDHEYWNNFPHLFFPGPTFLSRDNWQAAARAMYDAYQLAETGRYSYTVDVDPLSIFMMDSRTSRTAGPAGADTTMGPDDLIRFDAWVKGLLADDTKIPVVVTGPSLFQPPKVGTDKLKDLNFSNAADYPHIMSSLLTLASAGRPVLALTGDVHYGRTIYAIHKTGDPSHPWTKVHEVISSPTALVKGLARPHVDQPLGHFEVAGTTATLHCTMLWPLPHVEQTGDHVALLKFRRAGTGVELQVDYRMVDDGPQGLPHSAPPISLQRFPALAPVT